MSATLELLKKFYLFKDLTGDELHKVEKVIRKREYAPGDTVFYEGQKAESLYIVEFGSVTVFGKANDEDQKLFTISGGMHFGELPFLDNLQRSTKTEATEVTQLIEIRYEDLTKLLDADHEMALKFYRSVSQFLAARLRQMTTDLSFSRERNLKHF